MKRRARSGIAVAVLLGALVIGVIGFTPSSAAERCRPVRSSEVCVWTPQPWAGGAVFTPTGIYGAVVYCQASDGYLRVDFAAGSVFGGESLVQNCLIFEPYP